MTFTEAKPFIEHYFAVRQPIRQYLIHVVQAREQGSSRLFGRRRPGTPDVGSSNFMVRSASSGSDEYANQERRRFDENWR